MRNFWGLLLSRWSWLGGGTFMLQHVTSSGRKSACLILVLWVCQAKLRPYTSVSQDLRAPGANSLCSDTPGFPREGSTHCTVLCVWENRTFCNELLPVSAGDEGMRQLFPSSCLFEVSQVANFCYIFFRLVTQMKSSKYFWVQSYSWSYCKVLSWECWGRWID